MSITLTVGTNTYISLADAETYFAQRLFSTDWSTETDDNKSMALIAATKRIDRLSLQGMKSLTTQTLAFPRAFYIGESSSNSVLGLQIDNIRGEGWYVEQDVQTIVKEAQCEEAIAILSKGADANKRQELQRQGVKRFSIGNLSEEYSMNSSRMRLFSKDAEDKLNIYLAGGVRFL